MNRRVVTCRALLAALLLVQAGCSPYDRFVLGAWNVVEQGNRAGSASTFAAVEGAWPTVPVKEGRLVLFSSVTNITHDATRVMIDGRWETSLSPWSFLFIDLPAGEHLVEARLGQSVHPLGVSVTTSADRITFVSILDYAPPLLVEDAEARRMLRKHHHEYVEPRPLDQQMPG